MQSTIISILRNCTPPLIWQGLRKLFGKQVQVFPQEAAFEHASNWYDKVFQDSFAYNCSYRESNYYHLWCVIVDRVLRSGAKSVLDVGCGPGQVAKFFHDKGLKHYVGLDFSAVAIEKAKSLCPAYHFVVADALDTDIFEDLIYDTVVCMEFLEHISRDLDLFKRIKSGTKFFGTVPNFAHASHVRHFSSRQEVAVRYSPFFYDFCVDEFDMPRGPDKIFVFEGISS